MFYRFLLASLTIVIGLTWVEPVYAATMTVICSSPKGFTILNELGKEVRVVDDGFSGVNPTFVIEGDKNKTALVVFGSTKIPGVIDPVNAERATIVISNNIQISMVSILGDQVWTYSLYPKHGFGLFSYHSRELPVLQNDIAKGSIFQSKCQFSRK